MSVDGLPITPAGREPRQEAGLGWGCPPKRAGQHLSHPHPRAHGCGSQARSQEVSAGEGRCLCLGELGEEL